MKAKKIIAGLLFLIATSVAQITYLFTEDSAITICPAITFSDTVPSFRLQPNSANEEFLLGSYDDPINSGIPGARFDRENNSCENNNALTCSKLSLVYQRNEPVDRGTFTVTFRATNGATQKIRVNYGYVTGIYLEGPGLILGRIGGNMSTLNNNLSVFSGVPQPLVLCYGNGTVEDRALFPSVLIDDNTCSGLIAGDIRIAARPGRFKVVVPIDVVGEHTVYVAGRSCSSEIRSRNFTVILDPEDTDPTSPPTSGTTASPPTSSGLPLGGKVGLGVAGGLVLLFVVIVAVCLFIWYKKKRKKKAGIIKNGSLQVTEGQDGGLPPSPELHTNHSETDGLVDSEPPLLLPKKKLYIVPYFDPEKTKLLEEKLRDKFSDLEPAQLPDENGTFDRHLKRIMKEEHTVIILGDTGELSNGDTSQPNKISSVRRWVTHITASPAFSAELLQYIFWVRFRSSEIILHKLQQIAVIEHPDDDGFDPAAVAKFIHEYVEDMKASRSQNQLNQQQILNQVNRAPDQNSSHSSTPQMVPHNTLLTSDVGLEPSENESEDKETCTDTNESQSCRIPPLINPTVAKLKGSSQTSSKSGGLSSASAPFITSTTREEGDSVDDPLKSSSLHSMDRLEKLMEKKIDELGEKVVEAVKKEGGEIKDKVGRQGEKIKEKVEEAKEAVVREVQENNEYVANEVHQARTELQDLTLGVNKPYKDSEGSEEAEGGGAVTREDSA